MAKCGSEPRHISASLSVEKERRERKEKEKGNRRRERTREREEFSSTRSYKLELTRFRKLTTESCNRAFLFPSSIATQWRVTDRVVVGTIAARSSQYVRAEVVE